MASYNVSRLGASNQGADSLALFLKVFSGEVISTFEAQDVVTQLHQIRTISSGKSAQFPYIGNVTSSYHVPGNEIVGTKINHAETVINVDGLYQANASIANIDEAMNHYDVRSQYTSEIARQLYDQYARRVWRVLCRSARSLSPLNSTTYNTDGATGAITNAHSLQSSYLADGTTQRGVGLDNLANASNKTVAANLAGAIFVAAQALDDKNVPANDRFVGVAPAQYYLLVANLGTNVLGSLATSAINRDVGGNGSISSGTIPMIAGCQIVKSVQFPTSNVTNETVGFTGGNNYNGDFSKTAALVFQKGAAGTVKLLDMATESEYSVSRQATLVLSKYAMGHGVLRPWCAAEITTGEITNYSTQLLPTA